MSFIVAPPARVEPTLIIVLTNNLRAIRPLALILSPPADLCGQFCKDFPNTGYEGLTFRRACNAIIHAVEILSYDPDDEESTKEGAWKADYYKGTIIIRGKQGTGRRQKSTRALLNCEKFAEYCIFLSEEFTEEV